MERVILVTKVDGLHYETFLLIRTSPSTAYLGMIH